MPPIDEPPAMPGLRRDVGMLDGSARESDRCFAEDLRQDVRLTPKRVEQFAALYGDPPPAADTEAVIGRMKEAIVASVRDPAGGGPPAFAVPRLNEPNLVPSDIGTRLAHSVFVQVLDITFLLSLPPIAMAIRKKSPLDRAARKAERDLAKRGGTKPTTQEVWVEAFDAHLGDRAWLTARVQEALTLVAAKKPRWHPTWVSLKHPDFAPFRGRPVPAAHETVLARLGLEVKTGYYIRLHYPGHRLLGPAPRMAIPTAIDGGNPGLWHRAPADSEFTHRRFAIPGRIPSRLAPPGRRPPIAAGVRPRSGFTVDLRKDARDIDPPAEEFLVEDQFEFYLQAWNRAGRPIFKADEKVFQSIALLSAGKYVAYTAARDGHRRRVGNHIT